MIEKYNEKKMYRMRWKAKKYSLTGTSKWFKSRDDVEKIINNSSRLFEYNDYSVEEAPLDDRKIN